MPFLQSLDHAIASKRISLIKKLMGQRVFDALCHMPSQVIQHTHVGQLTPDHVGLTVTMELCIQQHFPSLKRGMPHRILARVLTSGQSVELIFFSKYRSLKYLERSLLVEKNFLVTGKLDCYGGQYRLAHPQYQNTFGASYGDFFEVVYPLTAGMTSEAVGKIIQLLLSRMKDLPDWHRGEYHYPSFLEALKRAHAPRLQEDLTLKNPAKARLLHDEILAHNLSLKLHRMQSRSMNAPKISCRGGLQKALLARYPFSLTKGQEQAIFDIEADLSKDSPMLRLIQGDVGCGKTLVAESVAVQVVEDGFQVAVLVPTDILSKQHFENFARDFEPLGTRVELLTGKITGLKRQKILDQLKSGEISVLIGTHALIQDGVEFKNLGLVIVDEQHRFGVEQRAKLVQKGYHPHVLSMTATPIPRTLLMTNYGDVDISVIREKPAERKDIQTTLHSIKDAEIILQKLIPSLSPTNKAYWVCPLIEESETSDLTAAKYRFEKLQEHLGKHVGLLHGKMKHAEKESVMNAFKNGEIYLLVSTTVIEVGVDVRTANIMIIEHAERFGLAQLHQLRGRVGRSDSAANCLLLYEKLSPMVKERLSVMRESNDGFYLADADLKLRGGGDITGYKQSGFPDFRFYKGDDYPAFEDILGRVREDVKRITEEDPDLLLEQGMRLRNLLELYEKKDVHLLTRAA